MKYLIKQTDHGMDGRDARTKDFALANSVEEAIEFLKSRGYSKKLSYKDHASKRRNNE